jgi:antitoxin (DNA-binding transcriptional repressor) of toxin-antitoxin stability system
MELTPGVITKTGTPCALLIAGSAKETKRKKPNIFMNWSLGLDRRVVNDLAK